MSMSLLPRLAVLARRVAVLVLALGILVPTIDFCICVEDLGGDVIWTAAASDQMPITDQHEKVCIHSHCFHGLGIAQRAEASFVSNVRRMAVLQSVHSLPPAAPPIELLRPPRA